MKRGLSHYALSYLLLLILSLATSCVADTKWNEIEFYEVSKSKHFTEKNVSNEDDEFAALHSDGERLFDTQVRMQFMQSNNGISEDVCRRINALLIEKLLGLSGEYRADEAVEAYIEEKETQFHRDRLVREYVDQTVGEAEYGFENVINYRLVQNVFAGGAHPSTTTTVLRFNAMTGDFISLDNVFPVSSHDALIRLLTARLMQMNGVGTMEGLRKKGYLEDSEMFVTTNFALRKDSIEFYYNEYEIAPYAYGPSTICLDYATVEQLMNTIEERRLVGF